MSALALSLVTDTDCVASMRPLVLRRMPGRYVTGPQAILRRVLYRWLIVAGQLVYDNSFGEGLLQVEGATLGPGQLLGLRRRLEVAAGAEDYVTSTSVPVVLVGTELRVPGVIKLVDGKSYPLEVSISSAGAALRALGL